MSKGILFIGAGASFGAREKMQYKPPLGFSLCSWLRDICPKLLTESVLVDLYSTIKEAFDILKANGSETNFESLLSNLNREQRICLQRLLKIAFTDLTKRKCKLDLGFRNTPDAYDELIKVRKIQPSTWSIISLNYDILFEDSLNRQKLPYYYPYFPVHLGQDQSKESGCRVYKPHGSINFFAHSDHKIFHHEPTLDDDRGLPTKYSFLEDGIAIPNYPIVMSGMCGAENILSRASRSSINNPVMANYTKGKGIDVNDKTLASVRAEAIDICKKADEILIIGVHPIIDQADDSFVSDLLSIKFPKVTYICGSEDESALIKALFSQAEVYSDGLLKFLHTSQNSVVD